MLYNFVLLFLLPSHHLISVHAEVQPSEIEGSTVPFEKKKNSKENQLENLIYPDISDSQAVLLWEVKIS